jgi:signal transduction histidine kinase/ActR/RegA family two-component response regulator
MTDSPLALAVRAGRVGLFEWKPSGQASFSREWKAQLGYLPDELEATVATLTDRLHVDDRLHVQALLDAVTAPAGPSTFEAEYRLVNRVGEHRWFRAALEVLRDQTGEVRLVRGAQVEVHALRSAEARLLTLNVELSRVASAREDFLASMSHELRTPLNSVLGQAQALTEGTFGALTPAMRDALEVITASGTHLLSLLNTVLELARLEAGAVKLHLEVVGVAAVAHEATQVVRPQAAKKQLELTLDVRCGREDVASFDRLRVRQILVNLLANAVKFSPERSAVRLTVSKEEQAWAFSVRDVGPGIDKHEQLRLFHPFVQGDGGRARRHEGAGLGLALVKRLVDLHGGSIELESEPGKGSCFTVRLPLDVDAPLPVATPTPSMGSFRSALIVDDNILNVEPLRRYLSKLGVEVRTASSGPEALDLVASHAPQVMFLDWHMPGMDGLEVIRRMKQETWSRDVRIVTLTALVGDQVRDEALMAGADAFLPKPARLAEAAALAAALVHAPKRP